MPGRLHAWLPLHDGTRFTVLPLHAPPPGDTADTEIGGRNAVTLGGSAADTAKKLQQVCLEHEARIMIDLSGYWGTHTAFVQTLGSGLGHVQVSLMGFLIGMGDSKLTQLQLTDAVCSPPGSASAHAERFALMPHTFHPIALPPDLPDINVEDVQQKAVEVESRCLTFAALTQAFKIDPRTFTVWVNALRIADGMAVLALLRSGLLAPVFQDNTILVKTLVSEAASRGVHATLQNSSAILFADVTTANGQLLRLRAVASACLDTPLMNGGRTTLDCFTEGIPTVTMMGLAMNQRIGASLYFAGKGPDRVSDCAVTTSLKEYEDALGVVVRGP